MQHSRDTMLHNYHLFANFSTSAATASATLESNIDGIMYSLDSSSSLTIDATALAAASFISSVIALARALSAPLKNAGKYKNIVYLIMIIASAGANDLGTAC